MGVVQLSQRRRIPRLDPAEQPDIAFLIVRFQAVLPSAGRTLYGPDRELDVARGALPGFYGTSATIPTPSEIAAGP
jgi:hypothetical protein